MRIAFITYQFPVLANTFILNEITEILKRGHEVTIYALDRPLEGVVHADVAKFNLMDRTHFFLDHIVEIPQNRVTFKEYAQDRLGGYLHALPQIAKQIVDNGTDIIHAAFSNRPCSAALALAKLTGLPMTFESHARDLFVDFELPEKKIAEAARIFTISDYNKRFFVEHHGCPEDKVIVRRVSIVEEFCDSIRGGTKDARTLVSVARLHPIKGLNYALEAVAEVRRTHPGLQYHIVGDGVCREALEAQAMALGLSDVVHFEGALSNEAALRFVNRATAFVLPCVIDSEGDRDGVPTALIESMYLETPAVSTTVSGIPELIDDGENGCLVAPGDIEALANKIRWLLDHADARSVMGRNAREKVQRVFSADRNARIVLDTWAELLLDL